MFFSISRACVPESQWVHAPMAGWGILELARQELEAAKQRSQPQPTQTVPQPGSMEWLAAKNKSS